MKINTKPLVAGTVLLASLGLAATVQASPGDRGPEHCMHKNHGKGYGMKHGSRGFNTERMAEKLGLSEEQRTRVNAIVEESRPQIEALREKMRETRKQLREQMHTGDYNEAEVRKLADAQGDLKADMIVLRAQQRAEIRDILTEEQRKQMKEMWQKKHSR